MASYHWPLSIFKIWLLLDNGEYLQAGNFT